MRYGNRTEAAEFGDPDAMLARFEPGPDRVARVVLHPRLSFVPCAEADFEAFRLTFAVDVSARIFTAEEVDDARNDGGESAERVAVFDEAIEGILSAANNRTRPNGASARSRCVSSRRRPAWNSVAEQRARSRRGRGRGVPPGSPCSRAPASPRRSSNSKLPTPVPPPRPPTPQCCSAPRPRATADPRCARRRSSSTAAGRAQTDRRRRRRWRIRARRGLAPTRAVGRPARLRHRPIRARPAAPSGRQRQPRADRRGGARPRRRRARAPRRRRIRTRRTAGGRFARGPCPPRPMRSGPRSKPWNGRSATPRPPASPTSRRSSRKRSRPGATPRPRPGSSSTRWTGWTPRPAPRTWTRCWRNCGYRREELTAGDEGLSAIGRVLRDLALDAPEPLFVLIEPGC